MIIQSLLVNLTRLPKECGKEAMKTSGHVLVDVVHDTWNMKQKLELKHKLLFVMIILFNDLQVLLNNKKVRNKIVFIH